MHLRRKYRMPNSIEVVEFNSAKCPGKCRPRRPKTAPTCEAQARNNQRRKQRACSRMIEKYFNEDDCVFTLTYAKNLRPAEMKACLKDFSRFARYLKRVYAKKGYELFWIRNAEVGERNAWHIHLVVNRIEGTEYLVESWWRARFGAVYSQHLKSMQDKGCDLGEYISKTAVSHKKIVQSSWGHSRNIKKVEPEETRITRQKMTDRPRVPKGWYLDENTMYAGENIDGYQFRTYIIRRIVRKRIDHRMSPARIRAMERKKCSRRKAKSKR